MSTRPIYSLTATAIQDFKNSLISARPQIGSAMKWLTPEEAIAVVNLTVTTTKLTAIAKSTKGKQTAEERFQALGLLFDRGMVQGRASQLFETSR